MHIILICGNIYFLLLSCIVRERYKIHVSVAVSDREVKRYIYDENIYGTVKSGFFENGTVKYITREVMN